MASEGDTDEGDTAGGTSQEQQQLVHLHHPSLLIYGDERNEQENMNLNALLTREQRAQLEQLAELAEDCNFILHFWFLYTSSLVY